MIKNVLSIDIDFLFKECADYSQYVDPELTPSQSWQVIRWKSKLTDIKHDEKSLSYILQILREKCKKAEVVSIQEHDEIIQAMDERFVSEAILYNIDNHHDISYESILKECNLSNWVTHARHRGYIKEYNWIRQDDSKYPINAQIQYLSGSYKDVGMERIPEFDLVVICTSKHYTPERYWCYNKLLCNYLFSHKKKFEYFREVPLWDFPKVDKTKYPEYWNGDYAEAKRYFKFNDFYIEVSLSDGIPFLSMINFGSPIDILNRGNDVLNYIIDLHGKIGFYFSKNFKTRVYVERISKRYKEFSRKETQDKLIIILEKGVKNE